MTRQASAGLGLLPSLLLLPGLAAAATGSTDVPLAQRVSSAQTTAQSSAACVAIKPFYWEIGDAKQMLVGGSVGSNAPTRDTTMAIASASKWIYSAYVAERRNGQLTADDIRFLTFRSGYTRFRICRASQTVGACMKSALNGSGEADPATVGRFAYSGGHMQEHATELGLGDMDSEALAAEMHRGLGVLGKDWSFSYKQAQLAGGASTSAGAYAHFLQAVVGGELQIGKLLGTHSVCTNPQTCPSEALRTPIPKTETWHYSIGHWVEDDPAIGDGAFSSPGAFGFYPWISQDKQFYGVVARQDGHGIFSSDRMEKPGVKSVDCGREIRAAWLHGQARP